jgi:hypothetical protein
METFINAAMVIEVAAISVLAALWMTWLGLRSLFNLMLVMAQATIPTRFAADRQQQSRQSTAA